MNTNLTNIKYMIDKRTIKRYVKYMIFKLHDFKTLRHIFDMNWLENKINKMILFCGVWEHIKKDLFSVTCDRLKFLVDNKNKYIKDVNFDDNT